MDQRVQEFFRRYETANDSSDVSAIGELYADTFMFCGPNGAQAVKREDFLRVLPKMKAYFSSMRLSDTQLHTVEARALDSRYVLAKVAWRMSVRNSAGMDYIDAFASYLLASSEHGALSIVCQIDHQDLASVIRSKQHSH
jgi:ketosteroid isomerase-like protein